MAMRSLFLLTCNLAYLLSIVKADGCGKSHNSGSTNGPFTIQSGGIDRQYIIHVPSSYDPSSKTPLILSYHGRNRTMYEQETLSQFSDETLNPDMLAVYPQGLKNGSSTAWEGASYANTDASDKVFTTDLLNHLRDNYCIDNARIYANGKSNGGGFVGTLACSPAHGGDFAAFSACSGAFYTDNGGPTDDCQPARSPLPWIEFHGSEDHTIHYSGGEEKGGTVPAIPDWLNMWASRNGCAAGQGETQTFTNENAVNHTTWSCNGIDDVVDGYWVSGMGHDWPSTSWNDDNDGDTAPIDATPIILDFFRRNYKP